MTKNLNKIVAETEKECEEWDKKPMTKPALKIEDWERDFDATFHQLVIDYPFAAKRIKQFISQALSQAKEEERKKILQIVLEDVPWEYQERLIKILK